MSYDRSHWNKTRWDGSAAGHYESFFQRANHPTEPRAFWIRYTIFQPSPEDSREALGELWAIYFDGAKGQITAVRQTCPLASCTFDRTQLGARILGAELNPHRLDGGAELNGHRIDWALDYTSPARALCLFSEALYDKPFPKAKALVGSPLAAYTGTLKVDGESISIDGWVGSQNHNWGSKHTDAYAWGQVAGFDDAPDVFLELSTARLKLGPIWTPPFTPVVLRVGSEELALNGLLRALRNNGDYDYFSWRFDARGKGGVRVFGTIEAPRSAFVGLTYLNPPGGSKTCLNSKIASCELTLERKGQAPRQMRTQSRAAFEILTDLADHGVPVVV